MKYIILYLYLFATHCNLPVRSENLDNEDSSFIFFSDNDELVEDGSQIVGFEKSKSVFCDSETLASFLAQLQVISPETVIALATAKDIDHLCLNVSKAQDKLQNYLKTCTLSPDEENYKHIFSAIKTLHAKLCKDSKYHALFLQYADCFGKLKSEFDSCNGPADWSENSEDSKICKAYKDMADCYFLKASVLCGTKAADVFKELVMAFVDSVIIVNCTAGSSTQQNTSFAQSDHIVSGACICSSTWYKIIVKPFIDIYDIVRLFTSRSSDILHLIPANTSDIFTKQCLLT